MGYREKQAREEQAFSASLRERVAMLVDGLTVEEFGEWLSEVRRLEEIDGPDELTPEQHRNLGWIEGAAEALGQTVLEMLDDYM